jgi:hypothetical protein
VDDCVVPTTTIPCKVQPDGTEICEPVPLCPQVEGSAGEGVGAPDVLDCTPPQPIDPMPLPQPVEIVLVDAEPSLLPLPGTDGRGDAYLVPAYRFTAEDGGQVDLPAVADEALAGPPPTEVTIPETVPPDPVPEPEPQPDPCEVLEEEDSSGTTHTIQPCPPDVDVLEIGQGYQVDIDVQCLGFLLGGRVWVPVDAEEVTAWARPGEPFEGGTFTLDTDEHGTFVGDAAGTKVADFRALGPAEDIFCSPRAR